LDVHNVNITELTHFVGKKEDLLSNEAKKKSFVMLNIELLKCNSVADVDIAKAPMSLFKSIILVGE